MPVRYYKYDRPFKLENGETLDGITIAYHTYGKLRGDNVVWVCHALTANSNVEEWWPHTVEADRFLDPARWFVVCANVLGSHYGTTGPLSVDPATGEPYYGLFPFITVRDMVRAHMLLAEHLGISRIHAVIGSSIGGFQALEMAMLYPEATGRLILIATSARSQPWSIALNESQRMSIESDESYGRPDPDAGKGGMRVARSLGLLSYRGSPAYNLTQQENDNYYKLVGFRAASYQQYQGDKLCRRFNAYSYYRLTQAFDSHNVGRYRGGVESALGQIGCRTMIVGISSDILFPVAEQIFLYRHIPNAELRLLSSEFGHDGFLVEYDKLNAILKPFIDKQ
ncbi:MAG: homoserine O-acetyltransferase [Rikenellaceae bacterium]|jgi:homoserine O-acetyltransferase|nr:homoserine O-acetyltransferase [Rikenellaceae bacterium]